MSNQKTIEHHNEVNCEFSESVYQKMATKRFGIEFCCSSNLELLILQKQKLDLAEKRDEGLIVSFYQGQGEFAPCEFPIEEVVEATGDNTYSLCQY